MPRNYMGPSPKNPTLRQDGGIGSPNGMANVDAVYQMTERPKRPEVVQYVEKQRPKPQPRKPVRKLT